MLNWNQKTLADKTGVALKTVRAFETGRTKPLGVTRAAIKQALEKAGVEFLDGDGVRLKK
jgi:DNA-binding XRE family transcriptional regulator